MSQLLSVTSTTVEDEKREIGPLPGTILLKAISSRASYPEPLTLGFESAKWDAVGSSECDVNFQSLQL